MTFEDFIVGLDQEAPALSDAALRLLLHIVATSLKHATYTVVSTDREICSHAGIWRSQIGQAKQQLGRILTIETLPRQNTVFKVPESWFPLQMSLLPASSGPTIRPALAQQMGQAWPKGTASSGPTDRPTGPTDGPPWPNGSATVAQQIGHTGPIDGPPGPTDGPRTTGIQQLGAAPSNRIESISGVVNTETLYTIDRVLDAVEISPANRADADTLKSHLHAFLQQRGEHGATRKWPHDEIAAKCLAVAPVEDLLMCLASMANEPNIRPGGYIWFVVVFLDRLKAIPWKTTKQRMDQRRQRKQPGRAELLPFPAENMRQAVGGLKTLR